MMIQMKSLFLPLLVTLIFLSGNSARAQQWREFTQSNSNLPSTSLGFNGYDKNKNMWITFGGNHGVMLVDTNGRWSFLRVDNSGIPFNYIKRAFFQSPDTIWLTSPYGLIRYASGEWTTPYTSSFYTTVESMDFDKKGNIWVGSDGQGIKKFDGTNWEWFTVADSFMTDSWISVIKATPEGDVWFGTRYGGLMRFDGNQWYKYNAQDSKHLGAWIVSISIDEQKRIWIGTRSGFSIYNLVTKTWATLEDIAPPFIVGKTPYQKVVFDKKHSCTWFAGPYSTLQLKNNTWKILQYPVGNIDVGLGFLDTLTGNLWCGTSSTLYFYNENGIVSVSEPPVLSEDVEIFPNPSASRLQVRSGRVGIRAEVLTVLGQSVGFAESAGESVEFSTDILPTGAYFVRVWSGGKMTTKAFQVSK